MNARTVSTYFIALFLLIFQNITPARAAGETLPESQQISDVDSVSNELLSKEIEFLKLNTRLKLYLLPHNPWSARRAASIGFTNASLTAVGALMNGCGRFRYLYIPKKAPSPLFEDAGIVRFMANCLSTGAAVFEFANDGYVGLKERHHGVSLAIMHDRALALQHDIDELVARRNSLISANNPEPENKATLDQEGIVLKDLSSASANEFATYYAQAKGNKVSRRLGYAITIVSNVTSGAGTLVGIEANHMHGLNKVRRNHMGGVGGICDIISGSMNIAAPMVTRGGAALERHFARNKMCESLDCQQSDNVNKLAADEKAIEAVIAEKPSLEVHGVILRNEALHAAAKILEKRQEMRLSEQRAARNKFIENMAVSSVAGGTKIANGIGGTVGAFKFPRDSYHRYEWQGATAIAYGAGNALAALETARVRLGDEVKTYKNQKAKTSKADILNQQLNELDSLKTAPQLAGKPRQQTL